jgi:chemotaxis protein CheX
MKYLHWDLPESDSTLIGESFLDFNPWKTVKKLAIFPKLRGVPNKEKLQCLWIFNSDPVVNLFSKEFGNHALHFHYELALTKSKDSKDAQGKVASGQCSFVFIDDQIPVVDGIDMIQLLKSSAAVPNVAVFADQSNVAKYASEKNVKVFPRPLNMVEILGWISSIAGHKAEAPQASGGKSEVDVRVINSIIQAAIKVITQFGVKDVKMEKAKPRKAEDCLQGVISSYIEIKSAKFTGMMVLTFEKGCYLGIVTAMLGEEQKELNSENQDAAGEINNIIYGNAKSDFSSYGIELTIPKVVVGENTKLPCPAGSHSIEVPIFTPSGKLYVDVIAYPKAG